MVISKVTLLYIIYLMTQTTEMVQGSAQTIFSGGNLVSLGVCIFAMYVFVYHSSIQTVVLLIIAGESMVRSLNSKFIIVNSMINCSMKC